MAELSKANQILINRGLQIEGLAVTYDTFHLSTYSNANYTAVLWLWDSPRSYNNMSILGTAPGFPWARWVFDEADMPPLGGEAAYLSQLLNLQLADEWHLNDDATRTRAVNWFNAVRNNWPNTILSANNWGGQVTDANLIDFCTRAHPDMICFDTYPWQSVWDVNAPNHTGSPIPGPPTQWYGHLRTYRDISRAFNIPFGSYVQTFHAVQDYNNTVYRDPSPSELRLNHFGALAFNAKMLIDFLYNNGSSSLFNPPGGDSNPNALYYEKADCARRARNFGKALVRLKPIEEATASWTTSIMFIRGRDPGGGLNPIPINFYAGLGGTNPNTDWVADRNDPHLRGWVVTNTGTKNEGQPGDVVISWFKALDESLDGPNYTNETYFMVVNGLTATNGTAAGCAQEIKLNFLNTFSALDMLDPASGQLTNVTLPVVSTRRQLVLNLNGGDAALFKIANGAPFVGFPFPTNAPVITGQPVSLTNVVGTSANFSVTAAGAGTLVYQWRFAGTNIGGATASSYTRSNVQTDHAGDYRVVVTNNYGSVTSAVATLTVLVPPQITTQPQSRTVLAGSNVLFTVSATGTPPLSYQWRFNNTDLVGVTASSYTRINAQPADAGSYSVVVSNVAGSLPSSNAVLTVNRPPSITNQPQNQAVLAGGNASFSVGADGTEPLIYQWRKDGSNLTNGPGVSGATTANLTLTGVQAPNTGVYSVTVSNAYGGVVSAPATLWFATQPVILVQPQNQTNVFGSMVAFEVVASGGGLSYQWLRSNTNIADGGNLSGPTTDLLALSPATKFDTTSYTVLVTNAAGSVTSSPAMLYLSYQPPYREPFDYNPGDNLSGQTSPSGLTWADVGTSTAGPYVTIQSNNLAVTGLAAAFGNSIRFGGLGKSARLSFPSKYTNNTVYYSFALKILDLTGTSGTGGFIAGFNNSIGTQGNQPTVIGTRVYVRTNGGGFNLGLAKNSSSSPDWVWDGTAYYTNQTIFFVGSYTFTTVDDATDDISQLWINPNPATFGAVNPPLSSLSNAAGNDVAADQIYSFVFFQRSDVNEPAVMIADELRIGTSWAEVTPTAASVRFDSIVRLFDGRVRFRGSGDPGGYVIEGSPDLMGWTELTRLATPTGTFFCTDPASYAVKRYYRAKYFP